jgi:peptidoglycan/xylan/chitin deacetylase (PgdA/CDA1 family)
MGIVTGEDRMNEDKVREALKSLKNVELSNAEAIANSVLCLEEALAPEPRFYKGQIGRFTDNKLRADSSLGTRGWLTCRVEDFFYNENGTEWRFFTPDPDAKSLPVWIENDGSKSVVETGKDKITMYIHNTGEPRVEWNREQFYLGKNVVRYAIIPLPEYL